MNFSTAVFLINDKARAIRAVYEPHDGVKQTTFKTLDPDIKKDDLVVVPTGTRHGFTVVKVVEIDLSIDFEDKTPMEWIVGKVDLAPHESRLKDEAAAIEQIKAAEFKHRREALANALNLGGDLKTLPLADKA